MAAVRITLSRGDAKHLQKLLDVVASATASQARELLQGPHESTTEFFMRSNAERGIKLVRELGGTQCVKQEHLFARRMGEVILTNINIADERDGHDG
jgi:hypothetical protein